MEPVSTLWMYNALSQFRRLNYQRKIMLIAFVGTHIPLICLIVYFAASVAPDWDYGLRMIGVALAATLVGTAAMLLALHHLLRPITMTSQALRRYINHNQLVTLPEHYTDEVGTLMSDANFTLRKLDSTITQLKHYDRETGLINRLQFLRFLTNRTNTTDSTPFAVCWCELANLSEMATALGQEQANALLRQAVQRIEATLDYQGKLARTHDNGLAFVLDTDDLDEISQTLTTLAVGLSHLSTFNGLDITLNAHSGVTFYPIDGRKADQLFDNAVLSASFAAQENAPFAFYSAQNRNLLIERHHLERDLRRSLANGNELMLHYQPVIDATGNCIVGTEALIRWNHPERGMILPAQFIPLAETCGLIEEIGRWTLRTACAQIKAWRAQGAEQVKVAINVSMRQFNDPDFLGYVHSTIDQYQIEPGTLEIELTETSAMADATKTRQVLTRIRELGISVAIDDFGTGYSSMSHLRTLPFNKLKIDREFVQDVTSNGDHLAICRALIALANELHLDILAEGTETEDEINTLRAQGCHVFQGYYFSKPLSAKQFNELLSTGKFKPRRAVA